VLNVEQLPQDRASLVEIIRRQQQELTRQQREVFQRDSALELCDIHIEQIRAEAAAAAAAAVAAIAERDARIQEQDARIKEQDAQIEQIKREAIEHIELLKKNHQAQMLALLNRIHGRKGQSFDPAQLLLFGQLVGPMPLDEAAIQDQAGEPLTTRGPARRHNHGRGPLPAHLERIVIEHKLEGDQLKCLCCGKHRPCIGKVVTEQLEYVPASLKVLRHEQYKYGCEDCDAQGLDPQIELAPKPPQPIEKGLAGPGLLAHVITSKLADHLPLYRQERILARHGVHIADSTMCGWIMFCAMLVAPLVLLMKQRIKQGTVIWCDETGVPLKSRDGEALNGECHQGRIWAHIGDDGHRYIIYEYTPDKTNVWPLSWLEGFEGYLQVDAGSSFDIVFRSGKVTEVGCWAHGRRKFDDAKETDARRAGEMLKMIRQLYDVEDKAKNLSNDARKDLRQQLSVPILNTIKAWLDKEIQLVLPRSPMAGAMNYLLNQWAALLVYTTDGALDIDNNVSERALKLIAIGRRNWLFFGNDEFAKCYATLYSLIASAQLHGLDPEAYLTDVLKHIASTPISQMEQFLPDVWKAQQKSGP